MLIDNIYRRRYKETPPFPRLFVLFVGTLSLTPVIRYLSDRSRDESTLTRCTHKYATVLPCGVRECTRA